MKFFVSIPKIFATIPIFGLGMALSYAVPLVLDVSLEAANIPFVRVD